MILGLMRVAFGVYASTGKFVPTLNDLQNAFAVMPDVPTQFANDFLDIQNAFNTFTYGFTQINSLGSFFTAIGNVFKLLWTATTLIIDTLLIPIKWLIWVFTDLFGLI